MKRKLIYLVILVAGFAFAGSFSIAAYGQKPQNLPVKQQTVQYTCPMHAEVISDKPGVCPICGMILVQKKEKQPVAKVYTCPMHQEVIRDKPGQCPICGMVLVEKPDKKKQDLTQPISVLHF